MKLIIELLMGFAGRGLTALSALCLTILLPMFWPPEYVGITYFVISISGLLGIVFRVGADSSANHVLANSNNGLERNYKSAILGVALVTSLISILFSPLLVVINNQIKFLEISPVTLTLLSISVSIYYILFQLYRINGQILICSLSRRFFINLAFILLIPLGSVLNISENSTLFLISCASVALSLVLILVYAVKNNLRNIIINTTNHYKEFISLRFMLYSILTYFASDMDYFFIKGFLSNEELGVYATIKRVAILAAIYIDIAHMVLPKHFKENKLKENLIALSKSFRRLSFYGFFISLVFFIISWLFSYHFIDYFWGASYIIGRDPFLIIMGSYVLVIGLGFSEIWLLLNNEKNVLIYSVLLSVCLSLILNYIFIPTLGITGAALSFSISNLALKIWLTIYIKKKYKFKIWLGI